MNWLTIDMVEGFHRESLAHFGGSDGLRDRGLLESALARPENILAHEPDADVFRLAAAYGHGLVKNHPFIDGNKRTGTLAAVVFLGINGVEVEFDEAEIAVMIIGLAASEYSENDLADWLRKNAKAGYPPA
jgi:death on curing protein